MSRGTHFTERRVTQLPVEARRKLRAEVETAVPDGCDLAQIEFALFISKRESLLARRAVVSRETHIGRIVVGVKTDCVATLAGDRFSHSRDAVVSVAVCDDENGHRKVVRGPVALRRWPPRSAGQGRVRACPI